MHNGRGSTSLSFSHDREENNVRKMNINFRKVGILTIAIFVVRKMNWFKNVPVTQILYVEQ